MGHTIDADGNLCETITDSELESDSDSPASMSGTDPGPVAEPAVVRPPEVDPLAKELEVADILSEGLPLSSWEIGQLSKRQVEGGSVSTGSSSTLPPGSLGQASNWRF